MVASEWHPAKVLGAMESGFPFISTLLSVAHPLNAPSPIVAVASGSDTFSRALQSAKARSPMAVTVAGIIISFMSSPASAPLPIAVIPCGNARLLSGNPRRA